MKQKNLQDLFHLSVNHLGLATFTATDQKAKYAWINEASDFSRTMYGTMSYTSELVNKVNAVMQAIHQTPGSYC